LGIILTVTPNTEFTLATARETSLTITELFVPIILGALFPDVDTAFGKHRKLLHNVFVLGVVLGYVFVFNNLQFVWIGVATHYVLDIAGSKRGLALLYPLSSTEYDLPFGVATSSKYAGVATVVISGVELAILAAVHYYAFELDATAANAINMLGL
ncbi:MAG: metal-dependent hydrolase, partial [Haloferacaceae archaeon]